MLLSSVTATGRNAVASLIADMPLYASLHVGEPQAADPLSTIVNMTGPIAMRVAWQQEGSVLLNSMPVVFTGIAVNSVVSWVALTTDADATRIAFYGDADDLTISGTAWSTYQIPARTIRLTVV